MNALNNESVRARRATYLHEAGHVVVAIVCGHIVEGVQCDGDEGLTAQKAPAETERKVAELKRALQSHAISAEKYLEESLDAWQGPLTVMLGGLAGESLALGRGIASTRRATDDLVSYFSLLTTITAGLSTPTLEAIWVSAFGRSQDAAWGIVRERRAAVEALADALTSRSRLSLAEIDGILAGR